MTVLVIISNSASRDNAAPSRDGGASISGVTSEPVAVRRAGHDDLSFLQEMLYEAANRPGEDWPDFETAINEDRNRRFWVDWPREADIGVIAERNGACLGAAWIRRFEGHELGPFDDPDVPVLAIGVVRDHRGRGVGGALMDALIVEARRSGVSKIALSTGLFNEAALRLYRRYGFNEVARRGDGVRMVAVLDQQHT